jgi:SAM-dependent methyltransferase
VVTKAPFWHTLLACPVCRGPLAETHRCAHCGEAFTSDGGTPSLRAATSRSYTLEFSTHSWDEATGVLARTAGDPGPRTRERDLPYHVDAAQAHTLAALPRGARVLEIGCGGGQCRPWFRSLGHEYVGTDVSKTRVHAWLQEFGGPDLLCDVHFLPFQDRSFDAVYCAAVFEHLACPPLAMREILRVLRPGGLFCGNASFLEPWHDDSFFHLSPLGAAQLLLQSGFEPLHIWPGRRWSGFKAMAAMAFSRPLQPIARVPAALTQWLYGAQLVVSRWQRRLRGKAPKNLTLQRHVVAGATNWMARRPDA